MRVWGLGFLGAFKALGLSVSKASLTPKSRQNDGPTLQKGYYSTYFWGPGEPFGATRDLANLGLQVPEQKPKPSYGS